ncbi:MAG: ribosome maturation factor RimP [Gemmatimonadota bacterium]|nr:MAG: ribosome maturation factor RimP [Gemmatimonadota bacterium]
MAQSIDPAREELGALAQTLLEQLGFELVELEWGGHRRRPIVRLRIDRLGSEPGQGVTVDDCARVSRELEAALDAREDLSSSYILEVSSPGVERPLHKRTDFERNLGREIAVRGVEPLAPGMKRIEGVLLSVEGTGAEEHLRLRIADGTEIEVPRSAIVRANLVFRWESRGRKGRRGRRS